MNVRPRNEKWIPHNACIGGIRCISPGKRRDLRCRTRGEELPRAPRRIFESPDHNEYSAASMNLRSTRKALASDWFDMYARLGYGAKGLVFAAIGIMMTRVALGQERERADFAGAMETLSEQPLLAVLIIVLSIGMIGYATWRIIQGVAACRSTLWPGSRRNRCDRLHLLRRLLLPSRATSLPPERRADERASRWRELIVAGAYKARERCGHSADGNRPRDHRLPAVPVSATRWI